MRCLRIVDGDNATVQPGCTQLTQRLPDDGGLAGLARSGDGDDPRWDSVVQEQADEFIHLGALVGFHF